MTDSFPKHSIETAPETARPLLDRVRREYGHIPNVYAKMAESPALLEAAIEADRIFETATRFTPLERHAVMQTANRVNGCTYCLAAHGHGAVRGGVCPPETDRRLREGAATGDARIDALCRFTAHLVETRGWVETAELAAFLDAGYDRGQVLDLVLAAAVKTMTNYANHMTHPEIDPRYREKDAAE